MRHKKQSIKFTAQSIDSLPYVQSGQKEYYDSSVRADYSQFTLVIGKTRKTFFGKFRLKGKTWRKKFGVYPHISLKDAKNLFLKEVSGFNLNQNSYLKQKYSLSEAPTFNECAEKYFIARKESKSLKWMVDYYNSDIKEEIGELKINLLTKQKVKKIVDKKFITAPTSSDNIKKIISAIWNFAKEIELIESLEHQTNPASYKRDKSELSQIRQPRKRFLNYDEIKLMWHAWSKLDQQNEAIMKLCLMLGQHPISEICNMRWDQIVRDDNDDYWWEMEPGFHKVGKRHYVYLHPEAISLINNQKGNDNFYVFPVKRYSSFESQPRKDIRKAHIKSLKEAGIDDFQIRDLRPTMITHLEDNGFNAGKLVGHSDGSITDKHYIRGKLAKIRKNQMNFWITEIFKIIK